MKQEYQALNMQNFSSTSGKRKLIETSPDNTESFKMQMESNNPIQLIKGTINTNLDGKLKNLSTKADLEEIKNPIL